MAEEFWKNDKPADADSAANFWANDKPAGDQKTALGDLGRKFKSGIEQLPGMVTGLADIAPAIATGTRPFTATADYLGSVTGFTPGKWSKEIKYSDSNAAEAKNVDEAWAGVDAAQKDPTKTKSDVVRQALTDAPKIADAYIRNPMYTAGQIAESVPSMLAGGAASKGFMVAGRAAGVAAGAADAATGAAATTARSVVPGYLERTVGEKLASPIAAGAGEGAVTAGQQMDQYEGSDQQRNALASLAAGVGTGVIGIGAGRVAQKMGLETSGTAMAQIGDSATTAAEISAKRRILGGMISEAVLQELPQSAQEQVWQNYANGKPLMDGVLRSGVEGALAGAAMGAGANIRGEHSSPHQAGQDNQGPEAQVAQDQQPLAPTPTMPVDRAQEVGSGTTPETSSDVQPAEKNQLKPDDQAAQAPSITPVGTEAQAIKSPATEYQAPDAEAVKRENRLAVVGVADLAPNSPLTNAAITAVDSGMHQRALATPASTPNTQQSDQPLLSRAAGSTQSAAGLQQRLDTLQSEITSGIDAQTGAKLDGIQVGIRKAQANQLAAPTQKTTQQEPAYVPQLQNSGQETSPAQGTQTAQQDVTPIAPEQELTRAPEIATGPARVLQNRDRSSVASIAQMNEIAAKPDYWRAGQSRVMDSGAPVVFGSAPGGAIVGKADQIADGLGKRVPVQYAVVESVDVLPSHQADGAPIAEYQNGMPGKLRAVAGNGRAAGISEAYRRNTAAQYRQDLIDDAADLGVDPVAVRSMKAPVLVRVMPEDQVTDDIGDRSNIGGTAALSATEQAANDARRIDLSGLTFDDNGIPDHQSAAKFVNTMPMSERGTMMQPDGSPTRQLIDRITSAAFKAAYGNDDVVRLQAQSTDPEIRNIITAMASAAGPMAGLEGAGDFDVRGAVAEAAQMAVNAKRQGITLTDYLNNADITFSGEAFTVARFMAENIRSAKRMADGLRAWANYAAEQVAIVRENEYQNTMFGATPTASRGDTFNQLGATNEQTTQIKNGNDGSSRVADRAPRQEAQPAPEQNRPADSQEKPATQADRAVAPEQQGQPPAAQERGTEEVASAPAVAEQGEAAPETPIKARENPPFNPSSNAPASPGVYKMRDGSFARFDRNIWWRAMPSAKNALLTEFAGSDQMKPENRHGEYFDWIPYAEISKRDDFGEPSAMRLVKAEFAPSTPAAPTPPAIPNPNSVIAKARTAKAKKNLTLRESTAQANAERETITPANDKAIGTNNEGQALYQRADESIYRMNFGRPYFGDDLVPATTESVQDEQPAATQPAEPTPDEKAAEQIRTAELTYNTTRRLAAAYQGEPYKGVSEDYKTLRADLEARTADQNFKGRELAQGVLERFDDSIANKARKDAQKVTPKSVSEKAQAANEKKIKATELREFNKEWSKTKLGKFDTWEEMDKFRTARQESRANALAALEKGTEELKADFAKFKEQREAAKMQAAAPDTLTAPTPQDILDQQTRAEAAAQAEKSQQRAADERARHERERKDIAKASESAANTFVLGGDAEQNLSGQQSVFDAPAPKAEAAPETTPKPAKQPSTPAPTENSIFTKDAADAARARLLAKRGRLNSGIDPEMLLDGITLAGYHIERGARTFAAYAKAMISDLGDDYKPYLKSWYMGVKFDPRAASFEGMDSSDYVENFKDGNIGKEVSASAWWNDIGNRERGRALSKMGVSNQAPDTVWSQLRSENKPKIEAYYASLNTTQAEDEAPESPASAPTPAPSQTLTQSLATAIEAGNMPKDNPALKKLVEAFDGRPADQSRMKQAQEELETAIAMTARKVVAKNEGDRSTFDALLRMYESQPNLNVRTSTSIANQAYSTPAPLAFLASRLAGITSATVAHEPTAGTGMLLISADPKKAIVNELNDLRIGALEAQGFTPTQKDAATQQLVPAGVRVDAVITNPPFGSVKDDAGKPTKIKVDGFNIGQIDHLIAARALEAMKQDGKATLILGANKATGGLSTDDRIFFNWLYANYNVTGHFEVNGDLYTRQGAGWPVRVISINGRMKSGKFSPVAGTIQRADNWSEVYEQFTQSLKASNAPISRTPDEPGKSPASVVPAPAPTGASRPRGGTAGAGNVTGTSPRVAPDRTEPAAEPVGAGADEQRLNAQSYVPEPQPGAKPAASARPAKPAGATALDDAPKGNEFQTPYTPRSARKDEGVLIPANMAQPTQDALSRLEDEVGDIDEFARKELGYKTVDELHGALMGLQVDSVATAIWQIKRGKAVVIADQTGIGKGRQAASIIRWAAKQGMTPVFVSVKPSLFTDMYGDLADIGTSDINPFILNGNAWIAGEDGTKLFANKPATHKATLREIVDSGELPGDSNAMFMTYSQINVENMQRGVLRALAPNAVFVLDESHNAAGASATGQFVIETLGLSKGVTYLSATYAKRPDNMPLYFKTDIGDAAADAEGLSEAMAAGGLPLQTVVSNNLVKAGQMFRRERSYDGVSIASTFDTPNRALHERMSNEATKALRAIVSADKSFHSIFVKNLDKALASEGSSVKDIAGNQASAGVQHTEFSSVVHNFVKQMLLGLKAQTAADEAIASLRRGEKPVIAVENTMGSFLNEYAASNNIAQGTSLGSFDYRTVLSRALERTRVVVVTDERGNDEKRIIPLSELDFFTAKAYQDAADVVDGLELSIPVSPIDWMRAEIVRAGFSVAEITGRNLSVDYSDPKKPVLSAIEQEEQKDKVNTTRLFNSGKLDALILNVAGSTGISLHASEKFEDQRQRHMIVAQAAGDINIFMQMIGRVHRTGQVRLPKYSILSVDLPTEKRPTAVLSVKMKSLNANTSSNTESATSVKTADILNKYGDQIVQQYLSDNLELARALGLDDEIGGDTIQDDIARKATGRLALQPIETQHAFYDDVEAQYAGLIEYLNKTNQNDLEPRTFDFDAKETRQEVLFEGPDKSTPFGEDAIYGEYSIKAQGHPMKPEEIRAAMTENLSGLSPEQHIIALVDPLKTKFDAYRKTLSEGAQQETASQALIDGQQFMQSHRIGSTFRVDINGEPFNAVVINIRNSHKEAGNPFSLSKMQLTVAVNGALRSLTIPATQFRKIEVSTIAPFFKIEQLFKEQPANQRETAKIVTGNLLAAYGEIKGARGTIITFTKQDGTSEQGILLPKLFDYGKNTRGDYRLSTGKDALKFLQKSSDKDIGRFGIMSRDGNVRVLPAGRGVRVQVPKSKLKGGKFFLDKELIAIGGDFVSMGSFMTQAVYEPSDAVKVLDALMKKQALYALPSMAEEAKKLTGDKAPAFSRATTQTKGMTAAQVQAIADKISAGWTNAPRIVVVANMADPRIPQAARDEDQRQRAKGATGSPEGFVHAGKVYLLADQLTSPERAAQVLLHESLGHIGLQGVFGSGLKTILQQIATMRRADVTRKAEQYGLGMSNAADRLTAAEEVLAEMAQTQPEIGFVKRAVAAIRTWLRDNVPGFKTLALTDAEIVRSYLLPARGFIERGAAADVGGRAAFSRGTNQSLRDIDGWEDMPAFQDDDESAILFNGGDGPYIKVVEDRLTGLWPGLFASKDIDKAHGPGMGENITAFRISNDKMLEDFDSLDEDEVRAKLLRLLPKRIASAIQDDEDAFDAVWKSVVEDRHVRVADEFNELFGLDYAEGSWEAQSLRGRLAAALGYDAVAMDDEHGTSWYIRPGIESIPLPTQATNPDIRFSRSKIVGQTTRVYSADVLAAMQNTGMQVEVPTLQERAKALWKDAGKKLTQGIVDQFSPVKDLSQDAYRLLRMSKGASGAFEAMMHGGMLKINDGVYDIDRTQRGGVIEKLFKPMQGEHHDFLRWVAANRAERLLGDGREHLFTQSDVDALKTLADGALKHAYTIKNGARTGQTTTSRSEMYKDSLVTFNEFNRNALDMAEQSGLIDAESRKDWESEFYVPFYRAMQEDGSGVVGGNIKGGVVRQSAFKHLKGGRDKLNADLLDNTLMNWAHLLDAGAKNRAALATLEAAQNMGVAIEANAEIARDIGKATHNRNGVVWAMDKGVQRYFVVDDPYIMTALTSLEYAGMRNPVMNAMGTMKRVLTVGVTASPFFKIRNLIRDSVQAIGLGDMSYNVGKNLKEGWKLTDPKSDAYFSLLASGGTIHFSSMYEGNESRRIQALVESGVDRDTILNDPYHIKNFYHKTIEPLVTAYNEVGNRGEAINRAALYDHLIKKGVSHAEAALQARDLMDFSMQGSFTSIRFLTQVVPFMNARLQGLYKLGKSAKENPQRFAAVLGVVTAVSLFLLAAYGDDDDWKRRDESDRNNFWWFKIGGIAYRIPKPFEIGSIATLAERGFELAFDKEMTNARFRSQVLKLLGDNLSMNPIPQLVKPMLDVYANIDGFSGRPIESMGMENLRPEYRFNEGTSMLARGASTALNSAANMLDKSSLSPVQIDHMLRGYFGWLGSFVIGTSELIARPVTGQPSKATPDYWKMATGSIASSLDGAQSRYISSMYEQANSIAQDYGTWRAMIKEGKPLEAQEYRAENSESIGKYHRIEAAKKQTATLNQQIKIIERGNASSAEKRERITTLRNQQNLIAKMAMSTE